MNKALETNTAKVSEKSKEISNTGKAGRLTTSGLFKEEGDDHAPYSLDAFRTAFLEELDSTGYFCAQRVLVLVPQKARWLEWKRLFHNPKLRRVLEEWREELAICIRAKAEKAVASGGDIKNFASLRYILEGGLSGKMQNSAGRPQKREKENKAEGKKQRAKDATNETIDKVLELGEERATA